MEGVYPQGSLPASKRDGRTAQGAIGNGFPLVQALCNSVKCSVMSSSIS
jgi:hypothetical protein